VMMLIDTSLWVAMYRDRTGQAEQTILEAVGEGPVVFTRFFQVEILQGARDKHDWLKLSKQLDRQVYLPIEDDLWMEAARIYYDLRRKGLTVRSTMDCLIAQTALDHDLTLLHNDKDFEVIAQVRDLQHRRINMLTA